MNTSRVDAVKVPGCFVRIEGAYATLRAAEQRVADFILKHPDELIYLTVTELAERTNTSESTVVRLSNVPSRRWRAHGGSTSTASAAAIRWRSTPTTSSSNSAWSPLPSPTVT